jgi:hypothetical protein
MSFVKSALILLQFLIVALHESGTSKALLCPWLNNIKVYITVNSCIIVKLLFYIINYYLYCFEILHVYLIFQLNFCGYIPITKLNSSNLQIR